MQDKLCRRRLKGLNHPIGLCLRSVPERESMVSAATQCVLLYVADYGNHRIQVSGEREGVGE